MKGKIQQYVASSTFHALPPCFFEGIGIKTANVADDEIPAVKDIFVFDSIGCGGQKTELYRPQEKEPFNIWISLVQPLGSEN